MVNIINTSAQLGGHYLPNSRAHVAACVAIVATRNVKEDKIREGIIGKTLKQYLNVKKQFDENKFNMYARYAHGGVPSHLSPDKLIRLFDDIQKVSPLTASLVTNATAVQALAANITPPPQRGSSKAGGGTSKKGT